MARSDIEAGKAYVTLLLNNKDFVKGLDKAGRRLQSFGRGVTVLGGVVSAAGAAVTAPLLAMVRGFSQTGSELFDMAQRTNLSVEALQELGYAAEQTGTSMEAVEKAIHAARKEGKSFEAMAAQIAAIQDPVKQTEKAIELFGKKLGPSIVPMLRDLPALSERFRELGIAMSSESAERADRLGDLFGDLRLVVKSAADAIGDALAPTVEAAVTSITNIAIRVRDWIRANRELFATALKVGAVVVGVGTAITGIGLALTAGGIALSGFASLLSVIGTVAAAIVSPIGLVVAAVAGLAAWFATSTEWGRQMVSSLAGWFGQLRDIAVETFGGIADALAAGDLQLAANVAWAGLKLAWLQGTQWIRGKWSEFKDFYLRTFTEMVFGAQRIWATFSANFQSGISNLRTKIGNMWIDFIGWLAKINATEEQRLNVDLNTAKRKGALANQNLQSQTDIRDKEKAALAEIDAASATAQEDRDREFNKEMKDREDALAAAKAELAALREKAANDRKDKELNKGPEFEPGSFGVSSAAVTKQIFGSFTAGGLLAGAGRGDKTADEIKKADQRQAKRDRQLLDEIRRGARLI